ncbi:Zinc finger BED domain-containing protein 4 [Lucilia cuprina]|nr:Zinc finger BED domain-containing protein 4 [Lucilia cuprina]
MAGPCNPVWNYFHRNESTATCVVCMKELSLGSPLPKNQTVSSIKKHLEKVHPHEYAAFHTLEKEYVQHKSQNVNLKRRAKRKRLKERKEAIEGPKERKKPGRKRKNEKNSESEDIEHKSLNIEIVVDDPLVVNEQDEHMVDMASVDINNVKMEHYKKSPIKSGDVALNKRIDKMILDLMVVDLLPFNIVEGSAFRRLHLADPCRLNKYSVKPANYYKNDLLPETYDSIKRKVLQSLEQAEWISLSTTQWWHKMKSCCLQVISGHFLHENQKHMVVLEVRPLESPQVITPNILDLSRKFNIVDKIHLNIVKQNEDTSTEWFTTLECSDYLLQKVIREALFSADIIEIIKQKCSSIIEHFVGNQLATQNLNECQELCGLNHYNFITSPQTSWTSTYLMWEKLIEQKPALEMYIQQYGDIQVPSEYEWQQIEYLVILLKIFYQAWIDLNSEAACVSLIIPLLTMLNSKLELKLTDSTDLQYYKKSLKSQLNQYFAFAHQSSSLIIATLLDPRFKMRYLNEQQLTSCHAEMTHNLRLSLNLDEDSPNPSYNTLPTNNYNYHNTSDLWESHDSTTITENNTNESVFMAFEQQLSFYLKEPLIARNGNIYQYWNVTPYEYLRKLAYKYLTAPPTRLAYNETICQVGNLYAERRLALKDQDDEKLLFMSCNIKLFNFEY